MGARGGAGGEQLNDNNIYLTSLHCGFVHVQKHYVVDGDEEGLILLHLNGRLGRRRGRATQLEAIRTN